MKMASDCTGGRIAMQFDTASLNEQFIFIMAKFKEDGKLKLLIIVGTRPEIIRFPR